ncbi:rCG33162, partial [Rattus norvegicus]
MQINKNKSIN